MYYRSYDNMKVEKMITLREKLLNAALQEITKKGYNGASVTDILDVAGGKKGSLYYHFSSKKDLALKMIEEKLLKSFQEEWDEVELQTSNHLDTIIAQLQDCSQKDFQNGCILGTLIQEISFEDADFNDALDKVIYSFQGKLKSQLQKAKDAKEIKQDIDIDEVSMFLISILQGAMLMSKMKGNDLRYKQCSHQMTVYLNSLRV